MASANLDLQDLNALLTSYTKKYRELEKYIGDLNLVILRINQTASNVEPDIINCGAYMRPKTAEVDLNAAKEKIKVIENKLKYIHELIDKDTATSTLMTELL